MYLFPFISAAYERLNFTYRAWLSLSLPSKLSLFRAGMTPEGRKDLFLPLRADKALCLWADYSSLLVVSLMFIIMMNLGPVGSEISK